MYSVNCTPTLVIGKQGENNAEQISVDFAPWLTEYGEGVISARLKRPKDSAAYPVVLTTDGTTATWTVSATDTQYAGAGSLQLVYIVGDVVAKSVIWPVRVLPSLEEGEAPEPYESWLDTLEGLAADTQENARDAADSAADAAQSAQAAADSAASITGLTAVAETLPEGSEASASFDASTDTLTLGIPKGDTGATGPAGPAGPKGDTGADGFSPTITVTEITGGHEVSVTDAEGTQTFNVMDGVSPVLDDEVTEDSANGVKSSGIYDAIVNLLPTDMASGSIASFPDGADDVPMLSLKAQIEPVQDLHGYDNPWPAGGGKNLLVPFGNFSANGLTTTANADGSITVSGTATSNGTYITADSPLSKVIPAGTSFVFNLTNSPPATVRAILRPNGASDVGQNDTYAVQTRENDITALALYLRTVSGTTYNFTIYPMIEIGTTGTSFEPYENICPITGWTAAKVNRTGKNLFPMDINIDDTAYSHVYYVNEHPEMNLLLSALQKNVGNTVVWSCTKTGTQSGASIGHLKFWINGAYLLNIEPDYAYTLPDVDYSKCTYIVIYGSGNGATITNCQLELGDTATEYEAYQSTSLPISWQTEAGTVYGGTLDVSTGELVVDRATVDLGTLNWVIQTNYSVNRFGAPVSGMTNATSTPYYKNIMCSAYKPSNVPITTVNENGTIGRYNGWIYICDAQFSDVESFKAAMSGVQLIYELAEPIEYNLTGQEVRTLLGTNNIWNDTGDTEVTYRADIQKYIEKKVTS